MTRPSRNPARRRRLAGLLVLAAALAATGCGGVHRPIQTPGARPHAGYDARVDPLTAVDALVLNGRRIALDPGHGGSFRGALGVNGLTEAEVNLGIALHLRGLLEARGASVFMTRTDDRDFLTPADSSLRGDLAARTALANAFHPELFLSIHHNADAGGAHDKNEIQTYYKLGDEGPSLDAAESVHRFLVRNLGIAKHRIMPGNYFVLRNSEAPALLTESSYITNPDVESKLALGAKQRLEAEALFLGIAHWFGRPRPRIEALTAHASERGAADTLFADVAAPILRARVGGAFDEFELTLDGAEIPGVRSGDEIEWHPPTLASGPHEARLHVRLAGGGASREERLRFTVRRDPAALVLEPRAAPGPEGGLAALRIRVVDAFDQTWRDSVRVRVQRVSGGSVSPADTTVIARDGVGWAYLRVSPAAAPPAVRAALLSGGGQGAATTKIARATRRDPRLWVGFLRRMPGDSLLADAPGTREPEPEVRWLNRDGFAVLDRDSTGGPFVSFLPGFRRWADARVPGGVVAIAGGALHGRRIVLDPDGGGDDPAGTGRDGTRGANLNLDVARALGAMLRAAGAEVLLTRDGDFAISDVERVEKSEAFHADRFLRIGHRGEPPRAGYYFSSAAGKRWAEASAASLANLGLPRPSLAEDAQYPLQQTSCPALYVGPARIDDPASEQRLLSPGTMRQEAYALWLALAREWAPAADWALDSLEVRDDAGRPLAGAQVTLGGLTLETNPAGRVRFARTEPGPLEVDIRHPRLTRRAILLDSAQGIVLTGFRGP